MELIETQFTTQRSEIVEKANAMVIVTPEDYGIAAGLLSQIKSWQAGVKEFFGPSISAAKDSYEKARENQSSFLTPAFNAEVVIKAKIANYFDEERRRVVAEQVRLNEEARIRVAEGFEIRGEKAKAEAALDGVGVIAPVIQPAIEKVNGLSHRDTWSAEVRDFMALVKAVSEGKVAKEALLPNEVFLNQQARSYKDSLSIAGVVAIRKTVVSSKRG